jgi:centrosomal protein CEP104
LLSKDYPKKHKKIFCEIINSIYQVEKFYSKNFLDKEEGLARLRAELTSPSNGSSKTSPNKTARAAAVLLQRTIRDKVFSVYSQTNEVVRVLFKEFVPDR